MPIDWEHLPFDLVYGQKKKQLDKLSKVMAEEAEEERQKNTRKGLAKRILRLSGAHAMKLGPSFLWDLGKGAKRTYKGPHLTQSLQNASDYRDSLAMARTKAYNESLDKAKRSSLWRNLGLQTLGAAIGGPLGFLIKYGGDAGIAMYDKWKAGHDAKNAAQTHADNVIGSSASGFMQAIKDRRYKLDAASLEDLEDPKKLHELFIKPGQSEDIRNLIRKKAAFKKHWDDEALVSDKGFNPHDDDDDDGSKKPGHGPDFGGGGGGHKPGGGDGGDHRPHYKPPGFWRRYWEHSDPATEEAFARLRHRKKQKEEMKKDSQAAVAKEWRHREKDRQRQEEIGQVRSETLAKYNDLKDELTRLKETQEDPVKQQQIERRMKTLEDNLEDERSQRLLERDSVQKELDSVSEGMFKKEDAQVLRRQLEDAQAQIGEQGAMTAKDRAKYVAQINALEDRLGIRIGSVEDQFERHRAEMEAAQDKIVRLHQKIEENKYMGEAQKTAIENEIKRLQDDVNKRNEQVAEQFLIAKGQRKENREDLQGLIQRHQVLADNLVRLQARQLSMADELRSGHLIDQHARDMIIEQTRRTSDELNTVRAQIGDEARARGIEKDQIDQALSRQSTKTDVARARLKQVKKMTKANAHNIDAANARIGVEVSRATAAEAQEKAERMAKDVELRKAVQSETEERKGDTQQIRSEMAGRYDALRDQISETGRISQEQKDLLQGSQRELRDQIARVAEELGVEKGKNKPNRARVRHLEDQYEELADDNESIQAALEDKASRNDVERVMAYADGKVLEEQERAKSEEALLREDNEVTRKTVEGLHARVDDTDHAIAETRSRIANTDADVGSVRGEVKAIRKSADRTSGRVEELANELTANQQEHETIKLQISALRRQLEDGTVKPRDVETIRETITELTRREAELRGQIARTQSDLTVEKSERAAKDAELRKEVQQEARARLSGDEKLSKDIADETARASSAVAAEAEARKQGIDYEARVRHSEDEKLRKAVQSEAEERKGDTQQIRSEMAGRYDALRDQISETGRISQEQKDLLQGSQRELRDQIARVGEELATEREKAKPNAARISHLERQYRDLAADNRAIQAAMGDKASKEDVERVMAYADGKVLEEQERAKSEEATLAKRISTEASISSRKEQEVRAQLEQVNARIHQVESQQQGFVKPGELESLREQQAALQSQLKQEVSTRRAEDAQVRGMVQSETNRATAAEAQEKAERTEADQAEAAAREGQIKYEGKVRRGEQDRLQKNIEDETARALSAEAQEKGERTEADQLTRDMLSNHAGADVHRADQMKAELTAVNKRISQIESQSKGYVNAAEVDALKKRQAELQAQIGAETERATGEEQRLRGDVTSIIRGVPTHSDVEKLFQRQQDDLHRLEQQQQEQLRGYVSQDQASQMDEEINRLRADSERTRAVLEGKADKKDIDHVMKKVKSIDDYASGAVGIANRAEARVAALEQQRGQIQANAQSQQRSLNPEEQRKLADLQRQIDDARAQMATKKEVQGVRETAEKAESTSASTAATVATLQKQLRETKVNLRKQQASNAPAEAIAETQAKVDELEQRLSQETVARERGDATSQRMAQEAKDQSATNAASFGNLRGETRELRDKIRELEQSRATVAKSGTPEELSQLEEEIAGLKGRLTYVESGLASETLSRRAGEQAASARMDRTTSQMSYAERLRAQKEIERQHFLEATQARERERAEAKAEGIAKFDSDEKIANSNYPLRPSDEVMRRRESRNKAIGEDLVDQYGVRYAHKISPAEHGPRLMRIPNARSNEYTAKDISGRRTYEDVDGEIDPQRMSLGEQIPQADIQGRQKDRSTSEFRSWPSRFASTIVSEPTWGRDYRGGLSNTSQIPPYAEYQSSWLGLAGGAYPKTVKGPEFSDKDKVFGQYWMAPGTRKVFPDRRMESFPEISEERARDMQRMPTSAPYEPEEHHYETRQGTYQNGPAPYESLKPPGDGPWSGTELWRRRGRERSVNYQERQLQGALTAQQAAATKVGNWRNHGNLTTNNNGEIFGRTGQRDVAMTPMPGITSPFLQGGGNQPFAAGERYQDPDYFGTEPQRAAIRGSRHLRTMPPAKMYTKKALTGPMLRANHNAKVNEIGEGEDKRLVAPMSMDLPAWVRFNYKNDPMDTEAINAANERIEPGTGQPIPAQPLEHAEVMAPAERRHAFATARPVGNRQMVYELSESEADYPHPGNRSKEVWRYNDQTNNEFRFRGPARRLGASHFAPSDEAHRIAENRASWDAQHAGNPIYEARKAAQAENERKLREMAARDKQARNEKLLSNPLQRAKTQEELWADVIRSREAADAARARGEKPTRHVTEQVFDKSQPNYEDIINQNRRRYEDRWEQTTADWAKQDEDLQNEGISVHPKRPTKDEIFRIWARDDAEEQEHVRSPSTRAMKTTERRYDEEKRRQEEQERQEREARKAQDKQSPPAKKQAPVKTKKVAFSDTASTASAGSTQTTVSAGSRSSDKSIDLPPLKATGPAPRTQSQVNRSKKRDAMSTDSAKERWRKAGEVAEGVKKQLEEMETEERMREQAREDRRQRHKDATGMSATGSFGNDILQDEIKKEREDLKKKRKRNP